MTNYEDLTEEERDMAEAMIIKANERNVLVNQNLFAVAKARCKLGLDITVCPCHKHDIDRGCISAKCYREIQETGRCSCNCFEK